MFRKILIVSLFCSIVTSAPSQAQQPPSAQTAEALELYFQAQEEFSNLKYQKAAILLNKASKMRISTAFRKKIHTSLFTVFRFGGDAVRSGSPERAIKYYRAALAIRPRIPRLHQNLGEAHCKLKEFSQCIANYNTAIQLTPRADKGWSYFARGSAYLYHLKDRKAAERDFRQYQLDLEFGDIEDAKVKQTLANLEGFYLR